MVSGMELVDFTVDSRSGWRSRRPSQCDLPRQPRITQEQVQEVEHELIQEGDLSLVERRAAQEPYCGRRVFIDVDVTKSEARFVIRDGGNGFDLSTIPDLNKPGALDPVGRRGLSLIQTFMDEARYNERGNEVTLVKRAPAAHHGPT